MRLKTWMSDYLSKLLGLNDTVDHLRKKNVLQGVRIRELEEGLQDLTQKEKRATDESDRLTVANLELQHEIAKASDRIEAILEDRGRLWDMLSKSMDDATRAYQMSINVAWQKTGAPAPYGEAPQLPKQEPFPESSIGRRARRLPSETVANARRMFMESVVADAATHAATHASVKSEGV